MKHSFLLILSAALLSAGEPPGRPPPAPYVRAGEQGALAYTADVLGNRIVDFSPAGYGGGGVAIPHVPAKIVVEAGGRDRERIQAAIDLVAALPAGSDGFRGAVLLKPGRYAIDTQIRIAASGVVLRGSGEGENGTVLVATGPSRRTLLEVGGRGQRAESAATRKPVADAFVPVGAVKLTLENTIGLKVGDRIVVRRPGSAEWIAALGMNQMPGWRSENRIQWAPGSRDVIWDRTIAAINGNAITLDAPITTSLDAALGKATVTPYDFAGRIERVGVEHLRLVSDYDRASPKDEEHAWVAVALDKVGNAWVRQVTTQHFVGYAFHAQADSSRLTIEDCTALAPVSELGGYRRRVFSIGGQLTLVQRCTSEQGLRDFTTGFVAAGPNVFLHCRASDSQGYSGPVESWASGVLYDNVVIRGGALRFLNRGMEGQGAGWTTANSVLWNCEATELQVQSPPGALNQAFGCKGLIVDDNVTYDPRWMPFRELVRGGAQPPPSLYLAQLAERRGAEATRQISRAAIDISAGGARALTAAEVDAFAQAEAAKKPQGKRPLKVERGQFIIDGERAWTGGGGYSWYLGQMPRPLARSFGHALTRFSPGETGVGATDDIDQMAAAMPPRSAFTQHYGLWYDRRRINHNFYGSPELSADDVTAPFMEVPWARSGQGRDWNGLSKYDLTKYNPWFFARVKAFADQADARGLILHHVFYFQHALQETRAHYVDFPWRPVNCLQDTGMPDVNPAGSTFYDVSHAVRRDLHRRYIRHCLDVFKDNTNVVHGIDREYSGPLTFVQFWLDTIAEWQRENGRKVHVVLEIPRAQMDALLDDPVRRPLITAIDFHHWSYRADGSLFAIEGGLNLAPREQITRAAALPNQPRPGGPEQRYRALREYRDAFPDLVIVRKPDDFPALSAAVEKAIPSAARAAMRAAIVVSGAPASSWGMAAPGKGFLVYTLQGAPVVLDLAGDPAAFELRWLDSASGELSAATQIKGGAKVPLTPPASDPKRAWVAWLSARS